MKELKKFILDMVVTSAEQIHERYVLLKLTDPEKPLPDMKPGQFAEVRVDGSSTTFLRRPISICFVDRKRNELWLLVATIGGGTRWMGALREGDRLNCVLPLGNGWTLPQPLPVIEGNTLSLTQKDTEASTSFHSGSRQEERILLVGGGVGVAPLLYQGVRLTELGYRPTFLLGARTAHDMLITDEFRKYGDVYVTTEDGSEGEKGFVTNHSILQQQRFDLIQTCGPTPMMKAVARYAILQGTECEASLENLMACGLGACLCCVEKTTEGNLCVCKEGPVFNIKRLLWHN